MAVVALAAVKVVLGIVGGGRVAKENLEKEEGVGVGG